MNRFLFFGIILSAFLISCSEKHYVDNDNIKLIFSEDTIHFDTVFTTIGTITRELRVINPYSGWVKVDEIRLAGESSSYYRLNIDGAPAQGVRDVEIAPGDSIFIFIDVIIDPVNSDNPIAITDSIVFSLYNSQQDVDLVAWGQDINLINGEKVQTTTWVSDKPYVIYNSMMVDTNQTLTIKEGAQLLFHRGSTMYVAGNVLVEGSVESPVIFTSDRLEGLYNDIPGQWGGVYFINGSTGNIIENLIIQNAETGLHLGNPGSVDIAPDLEIGNSVIQHMTVSGLSSLGGTITASNCVITHCGYYCVFIAKGGTYDFTHCTINNLWDYGVRVSPAVLISDFFDYDEVRYTGELVRTGFYNSVIYGSMESEISVVSLTGNPLNCLFDRNILKLEITEGWDGYNFENCIINSDPLYISGINYDFRPDTLSPMVDAGLVNYGTLYPNDIRGYSRVIDEAPDIGAYERQTGENSSEK